MDREPMDRDKAIEIVTMIGLALCGLFFLWMLTVALALFHIDKTLTKIADNQCQHAAAIVDDAEPELPIGNEMDKSIEGKNNE